MNKRMDRRMDGQTVAQRTDRREHEAFVPKKNLSKVWGIGIKVSKPSENAKMGIRSKVSTNFGLIPRVWYGNRPIFQLRDFLAI